MTDLENEPVDEAEPVDGKSFTAEYVKSIRDQAAKYRNEAKANKGAAEKLAALEEEQKSEIQKATARAEAAETALASARLDSDRLSVALAKGLDPELAPLLSGATKADIEAQAELLASRLKVQPRPAPSALKSGASGKDGSGMTVQERAAAAVREMRGLAT